MALLVLPVQESCPHTLVVTKESVNTLRNNHGGIFRIKLERSYQRLRVRELEWRPFKVSFKQITAGERLQKCFKLLFFGEGMV